MVYTFDSRVRFSEVGVDGSLSIPGLINYLQDCSTFQSEDVGAGVELLHRENRVWMTASWQIQAERLPHLGERIVIGTKAVGFDPVLARRNFFILDEEGEMIVRANSYWTMVNTESGRAMRITEEMVDMYGLEEPLPMENAPRRIRIPGEGGESQAAIPVTEDLLDVNHHVNNGKYIQLAARIAEEYLRREKGDEAAENYRPYQIRAEYKKAAVLGDVMEPTLYVSPDTLLVTLKSPEGEMNAIVELTERK